MTTIRASITVGLALLMAGCATTFVTSNAKVENTDGIPETMTQRAFTIAWGKATVAGSRPNATFTWLDDGSGEMATSGEVDEVKSENDIVEIMQAVGAIYAQALATSATAGASAVGTGTAASIAGALIGGSQ